MARHPSGKQINIDDQQYVAGVARADIIGTTRAYLGAATMGAQRWDGISAARQWRNKHRVVS